MQSESLSKTSLYCGKNLIGSRMYMRMWNGRRDQNVSSCTVLATQQCPVRGLSFKLRNGNTHLRKILTVKACRMKELLCQDHEIRTLQGLLQDYKRIISNHGHNSLVKSSYLKEIKEYGQNIGFHERTQKNVNWCMTQAQQDLT